VAAFPFWVPLVFGGSECDPVNLSGEMAAVPGFRIVENHLHRVFVVLVAVDQHHGPVSIWPLDRIGRDQQRSRSVGYVAGNFKKLVRSIDGLDPFLRDHL